MCLYQGRRAQIYKLDPVRRGRGGGGRGDAANERRKEGRDTRGKQKTVAKEERHERKAAANDSS